MTHTEYSSPTPSLRMGYVLGGGALPPVLCTLLDQDFLFYAASEEEEDGVLWTREEDFLPEEILGVHRACTRLAKDMRGRADDPVALFATNAVELGRGKPLHTAQSLRAFMAPSRTAQSYWDCMEAHGVVLRPSSQVDRAVYDRMAGVLFFDPAAAIVPLALRLAAELRRHWQDRQGALVSPMAFAPDEAILVNRAQQADLVVATLRTAWELHLSGQSALWQAVSTGPLSDLGRVFAYEALLDFRSLNNGGAAIATFEAWFLSPRCMAADKDFIQKMLLAFGNAIPTKGVAEDLYGANAALLAALGQMPYGENYLRAHVGAMLQDPLFCEVRERVNANFLWFIKFEQTSRQSEHRLQEAFQAAARMSYEEDNDDAPALVVPFTLLPQAAHGPLAHGKTGQIIYLRHT